MPRLDATTFDASTFYLDDAWTPNQLSAIAVLLKAKAEEARRSATAEFNESVSAFGQSAAEENTMFLGLDREAKRLKQQYEAVKAKLFTANRRYAPMDDEAVREDVDAVQLLYDRLAIAMRNAKDFQASVVGALSASEGRHNALHIAMLEIREHEAWRRLQVARNKIGTRPAFDACRDAAKRLVEAEQKMGRFYKARGMPDEIFACNEELDKAVAHWKDTTDALRAIEQREPMPMLNASEAQKFIDLEDFRKWLARGHACVLHEAQCRGVDFAAHLEVWNKAMRSLVVPDGQESMPEREVAVQGSVAPRRQQEEDSWSVLDADSDATVSQATSPRSASSQCKSDVSQCRSEATSGGLSRASHPPTPRRAMQSQNFRAARNLATQHTDSEDSDFDFAPARRNTSTPVSEGNRPSLQSTLRGRGRPEEFGDTTLGSLASVMPHGGAVQSFFDSTMQSSRAASIAPAPYLDIPAAPLDINWENRTLWFAPVRRGVSQGAFLQLMRSLGFSFEPRCTINKSNPVRRGPGYAPLPDEYYACVTFVTRAEAQRCMDFVNAEARDFGVTPLGNNDAMRKLDVEWCVNPHLNGKDDAYDEAMRQALLRD